MVGYKSKFAFLVVAIATTLQSIESCSVQSNTDYFGCDVGHSYQDTWEECAQACNAFDGCLYWTWLKPSDSDKSQNDCWYKNSTCRIAHGNERLISGDKACGESTTPPQTCQVIENIGYIGCQIGTSTQSSWRKCAEACEQTSGCEYWSWVEPTADQFPNTCYYKDKQCENVIFGDDYVSGNKACGTKCQVSIMKLNSFSDSFPSLLMTLQGNVYG